MLLVLFGIGTTQAQTVNYEKNNYLVLSKNIQQFKPVILTAAELAKQDGNNYGEFYVIFCGNTVQELVLQDFENPFGGNVVIDVGRMHHHGHQEPRGVHGDVPFAPLYLLAPS